MEYYRELKIEAETFDKIRNDINIVLQRTLGTMKEKDSMEGKVTIALDIKLIQEDICNFDPEIEGETRRILKPKFDHKVSSVLNIKSEKKGNIEPEMALEWDEESLSWVLKYVNNTEQRSMFDTDFQEGMNYYSQERTFIDMDLEKDCRNIMMIEGEVADETALPDLQNDDLEDDNDIDDDYNYGDVV